MFAPVPFEIALDRFPLPSPFDDGKNGLERLLTSKGNCGKSFRLFFAENALKMGD